MYYHYLYVFESIQKHINNDNTNNNKDINVITEKTISEEESKTSEVYENYNIQNKIKIPPDFTCQNNDINDLGNINENEEQKKSEENISINIKETKINIIQVENDTKSFDDNVKLKNSQNNKEPEKSLKFMDLLKKGEQIIKNIIKSKTQKNQFLLKIVSIPENKINIIQKKEKKEKEENIKIFKIQYSQTEMNYLDLERLELLNRELSLQISESDKEKKELKKNLKEKIKLLSERENEKNLINTESNTINSNKTNPRKN